MGAARVDGAERVLGAALAGADGRVFGRARELGSGRVVSGALAAGGCAREFVRGATLGRRASFGWTRADGRSCAESVTRADGRSCVIGTTRPEGRPLAPGATLALGATLAPDRSAPAGDTLAAPARPSLLAPIRPSVARGVAMRPDARAVPDDWSCAIRDAAGEAYCVPARRTAVRPDAEVPGFSLYLVDAQAMGDGRYTDTPRRPPDA